MILSGYPALQATRGFVNLDEFRQQYELRKSARPIDSYQATRVGIESGLRTLEVAPVSEAVFGRPPKHTDDLGCNPYLWVIDSSGVPYLIENPLKVLNGGYRSTPT